MSARRPAEVALSLTELAAHGGERGPHADGWGIAYLEGTDVRLMREPEPAAHSACVRFLESAGMESALVLSHIRRATQGKTTLANTQPFARELGGRMHVFAHNGDLPALLDRPIGRRFHPLGDTDSERAFLALLEALAPLWDGADAAPHLQGRLEVVARLAADWRPLGPANFLYTDGDVLFVHGHQRTHPDGMHPPGLVELHRECEHGGRVDLEGVALVSDPRPQTVRLYASVPLTGEAWTPLPVGEVRAVRGGEVVARA